MKQIAIKDFLTTALRFIQEAENLGVDVSEIVMKKLDEKFSAFKQITHFKLSTGAILAMPTEKEINIGMTESKINMVKEYKVRTGESLMDAKRLCEEYFDHKGLNFFTARYS